MALKTVVSIANSTNGPHGIYSVDMTYSFSGVPIVTEINIGRFFTTHYFFTKLGLNMPDIYISTFYNEPVHISKQYNPITDGWIWIRGMDFLPVLIRREDL
jgi:carbamoyl-phosphate synthase large subunit